MGQDSDYCTTSFSSYTLVKIEIGNDFIIPVVV